MIKIYPLAVLKEAKLYKLWKSGKYKPYSGKQLTNLVKSVKKITPPYVRIQRIIRDIPSESISAGPAKLSNLRQQIHRDMKQEKWHCRCIRCREVKDDYNPSEKLYLFRQDYPASGGYEIFLSYENKDRSRLYSLLRLRFIAPRGKTSVSDKLKNRAMIRELHTYGQLQTLSGLKMKSPQHKGLGKKLMKEAEEIAKKELKAKKIAVIAGVGARDYFRKLGYKLENEYMIKLPI